MTSPIADRPVVYLWHTEGLELSGIVSWLYRLRFLYQPEMQLEVRLVDMRLEPYLSPQLGAHPERLYDERVSNVPELLAFIERTRDAVHVLNYGYHVLMPLELLAPQLVGALKLVGMCHTDQDYYYANIRRFAPHLRAVIAASDACASKVVELVPTLADRTTVLPLGAIPVPPARDFAARRDGAPLRLLYAGRIEQEQKRVGDLVDLAARLGELGSGATLSIVGAGRDRRGLEEYARAARGAIMIAFDDPRLPWEMDSVYHAHDVLVLTSAYEGVSLGVIEAMLHGLVPVVTRTPGGHPLISSGTNSLTAPVGDVQALADCVLELERTPALVARLGMQAWHDAAGYQAALCHPARFEALVRAVAAGARVIG